MHHGKRDSTMFSLIYNGASNGAFLAWNVLRDEEHGGRMPSSANYSSLGLHRCFAHARSDGFSVALMVFCGLPKGPFWFCNVRTGPQDKQDVVASRHSLQESSACGGWSYPAVLPSAYPILHTKIC